MYSQEDIKKILFEDRFCVSEQCIYNLEVLDAFNKFNEPFMWSATLKVWYTCIPVNFRHTPSNPSPVLGELWWIRPYRYRTQLLLYIGPGHKDVARSQLCVWKEGNGTGKLSLNGRNERHHPKIPELSTSARRAGTKVPGKHLDRND